MNVNRLKGLMTERGFTQRKMAQYLDISLSSFHRKLHNDTFLVGEIVKIKEALHLTNEEASHVFFDE